MCTQTTTTTVNVPTPGYPQSTSTSFKACDSYLQQIDGQTTTSTSTAGSIVATAKVTTVCR